MKLKSLLNLTLLSADPIGAVGDAYFNTAEKSLKIHNGVIWVSVTTSNDPAPFYMHTHTFDGDVHTVDISNKITFENISGQGVLGTLPAIIGVDGGSALSTQDATPTHQELTLFDGGQIGN